MATCREVVEGALRKLGKLGAGRSARAPDLNDGFDSLVALYRSFINDGAFGHLRDVTPLSDYTAGENERIFRNSASVTSITLPELVPDCWYGSPWEYGSRWVPPGSEVSADRPPRDCSVVVISDTDSGLTNEYIFDGQQKLWVDLSNLTLDSEAPLSRRDFDGLKAKLAMQIADEYGGQIGQVTANLANRFQSALVNRASDPLRPRAGIFM